MPVLSICIPTYNRAGYLYFTLRSIVECEIFKNTDDVEIVISDNASTDLTGQIVKIFTEKFPDKIVYNRNKFNIGVDENFEKVLSFARGEVLKLHNDNYMFVDGALEKIVDKIKENREAKPTIFFTNGNLDKVGEITCDNLDEFVKNATYFATWIASFSIWKEDFDKIVDFSQKLSTKLVQTDVLLRLGADGHKFLIYNNNIFEDIGVLTKGGYNIPRVFGKNYLSLLKPYVKEKKLSKEVYEQEKRDLYLNHIVPMCYTGAMQGHKGWSFGNDKFFTILFGDYWYNLYFYTSIIKILKLSFGTKLNLLGRRLNPNAYQKYWRKRNHRNETTITKEIDVTKVFVGKNSTGLIDAQFSKNPKELLLIGDNVTIEENVKFVFGIKELIIVNDGTIIKKDSVVTR